MTAKADDCSERGGEPGADAERALPEAAKRALAEAAARRARDAPKRSPELRGRDGPDPVRYGDWESKGIAVDF